MHGKAVQDQSSWLPSILGDCTGHERAVCSSSKPTAACFWGFVCSSLSNGSRIWFLLNQEAETLLQLQYQGSSKKKFLFKRFGKCQDLL